VNGWVDQAFPNLRSSGFRITSEATGEYNCIAWSVHDTENWWWPNPLAAFWPEGVPLEETLPAFIEAFRTRGFVPCESFELEHGFEKIAIYVDSQGTPTHAARQLSNGGWTSKLGPQEDIEHTLNGLTGPEYGQVAQVLKRSL
jgi:hypothetical protein